MVRLNASSGSLQNTWYSVPSGCIGGGVWSSITIDQATSTLYVGTGTTGSCSVTETHAQALVALTKNLSLVSSWQVPASQEVSDGDFGATPTFFTATIGGTVHNMVGLMNKNGIYYAFDRGNISAGPVWQIQLSTTPDNFASSSWDGTHLYLAGNDTTLGGTSCRGNTQIYAKRVMTVLLTVYHLECPQKVQTTQTLTQRIFQLNFFRRHIV